MADAQTPGGDGDDRRLDIRRHSTARRGERRQVSGGGDRRGQATEGVVPELTGVDGANDNQVAMGYLQLNGVENFVLIHGSRTGTVCFNISLSRRRDDIFPQTASARSKAVFSWAWTARLR